MNALTLEEAQAVYDSRLMYLLWKGCGVNGPEIERLQQIEKQLKEKSKPTRKERQRLALIESFWSYQRMQLEASLGPHALEG